MSVEVELFGNFDIRGVPLRVSTRFGEDATVFEARLGDLSLGEVIEYVVGLAVPNTEVKLPPPWNVLSSVSLRDLVLRMDVTHGSVGILYEHIGLDLGFLQLDALELTYGPDGADGVRSVDLKLYGRLLERSFPYPDRPLTWDLLNEPPPAVPAGGTPAFRLDYLGLGQRITLRDPAGLGNMEAVIAALQAVNGDPPDTSDPLSNLPALRFDPAAGWLIGASFTVLGTLRLLAVFNDPELYGLRIELSGERAKKLAGLQFEILYRKVGPGLGVYHLELELPEAMRHLELGAVALTMPYLVVDVWTNGNFLVDLGFPHGLDFSRSFTLQTFVGPVPVVGAGGFYFGSLSSETSVEVPRITNGRFAPVVTFGIGLQLGVGRSIELGILRAGILIAVEGVLEGVIAFFEPEDEGVGTDVWYRVRGTVSLVGHIYGEVSFAIIKARIDIRAYASASLTLEAYATSEVVLQAGVSVHLKVRVAFFNVHLSFSATVRQSMTFGRAGHTPWRVAPPAQGKRLLGAVQDTPPRGGSRGSEWLRALEAPGSYGTAGLIDAQPRSPRFEAGGILLAAAPVDRAGLWTEARVAREVRTLDLYLQPVVTIGTLADRPAALPEADTPAVQLLGMLFMPRGEPGSGPAGFDEVAWTALLWTIGTARPGATGPLEDSDPVDREELAHAFHEMVASGDPERVSFCDIVDFLRENFLLRIRELPEEATARARLRDGGLALFPIPPYLTLHAEQAAHEADLQKLNPCTPEYRRLVEAYFQKLHPAPSIVPDAPHADERLGATTGSAPPNSMAAFIFADAARLVLRGALRAALDAFGQWEAKAEEDERLLDIARRFGVPDDGPDDEVIDDLAMANLDNAAFWRAGSALTLTDLSVRVRERESAADLAGRVGLELESIATRSGDQPGLLRPGATLHVEGGQITTTGAETFRGLAERFSVPVEELLAANPELPWPPDPADERLPEDQTVLVPAMQRSVREGDTLSRVADIYGLTAAALLSREENASSEDLLQPGTSVTLPPVTHEVAPDETPGDLAGRLGLTGRELVARTDAEGATYGTVRIPECRRLSLEQLRSAMVANGAFDRIAGSLARFLLAGLRLPDPSRFADGHAAEEEPDWGELPLYPLYVLTGQQWTCADGDPAAERVTLRRNPIDSSEACQRPLITFDSDTPDEALTVGLGAEEAALVAAYRKLAASERPVDPQLLAATRTPPFLTVPRRFALGDAVPWHTGQVPDWGQGPDVGGDPVILSLPPSLPRLLRAHPLAGQDPRLVLRPATAPGHAPPPNREVAGRAWATRIEVEVRRVPDPSRPGRFMGSVVEVFSTDGPGRDRLLELIEYAREHGDCVPLIHLLRPSNPPGAKQSALRSDDVDPAEVVLIKTNLSTWTRPPPAGLLRVGPSEPEKETEVPLHATLAEPLAFLQLLWEACIVAAGGFHLVYPAGDGGVLPEGFFGKENSVTFTVLVIVSPTAESERSIAAQPFHDCVVSAEPTSEGTPFVEPPLFSVEAPTSLADLAKSLRVEPAELALANASVADLIAPGTSLKLEGAGVYAVQPGDDLLSIAMILPAASLEMVAAAVAAAGAVIPAGTRGWTHPGWMVARPTLPPGRVGFRALRTDPDPGPAGDGPATGTSRQDDPATRLRVLYNLLDARVEENDRFSASPRTLPVAPGIHQATEALNPAPGAPPPWTYERVLRVAELVRGDVNDHDRPGSYPGLGGEVLLSLRLLDVFGNRCLPPAAMPPVTIPIRYTDPILGPGQWPAVAVGYRFVRDSGPSLELRTSFDVARSSPSVGEPFGPVRERAAADRATFAVIRRQLDQDDLRIEVASSLDSEPQQLDRARFAGFVRDADRWLATVEALEAATDSVRPGDTPATIAERSRIPIDALAAANAVVPDLLAPGSGTLRVPVLHVFARKDTLAIVASVASAEVTAAALASLNRTVPLRTAAELLVDGKKVRVAAGATLSSVAEKERTTVEKLGTDNADTADIFAPGTRLLVEVRAADVAPGSTLAALAADHGLGARDLLAANATNPELFAAGATVAVPDHVNLGAETAATGKVRQGDTLASLARRLEVDVAELVQANLALDGLLAVHDPPIRLEATTRAGKTVRTQVLGRDTFATAIHRLRMYPGCEHIGPLDIALHNADRADLLFPGSLALAPAPPNIQTVRVAPDYTDPVIPLDVWLDFARDPEMVDPALPADSAVRSVRAHLPPSLRGATDRNRGTHATREFAHHFHEAFPELALATASGAAVTGGSISLIAVQLQNKTVNWRVGSKPVFFAPRPLLTALWSSPEGQPVPVRPYADGELKEAVSRTFHGIDLDVWGRALVEAVDRFLAPDYAVPAQRLCGASGSDAYDRVVRAKAVLAAALRDSVEPVLDDDLEHPARDPDAAREALYQQLLVELSEVYRIDSIVQLPVTVHSPFEDRSSAPRLYGRVIASTCEVPPLATLSGVADDFDAPVSLLARMLAHSGGLLVEGATIEVNGQTHQVEASDTLASIATAMGVDLDRLALAIADQAGLLRPAAPIDLITRRLTVGDDETLGTLLEALADGVDADVVTLFAEMNGERAALLLSGGKVVIDTIRVRSGDTLLSIAQHLSIPPTVLGEVNARKPDVLRPGTVLQVEGSSWQVSDRESLEDVAKALGIGLQSLVHAVAERGDLLQTGALLRRPKPLVRKVGSSGRLDDLAAAIEVSTDDLISSQLDTPNLLRKDTEVRWLTRRPAVTLSEVKVPLVEGASLTFLVRTSSTGGQRRLYLEPELRVTEIEYDVRSIPWAGAYQASRWLTLVDPAREPIRAMEIPVPLRVHPSAPTVLQQEIIQRLPAEPSFDALRRYDYRLTCSFERSAQDQLFFDAETNVPQQMLMMAGGPDTGSLPYVLAQYQFVADRLWRDLETLRDPAEMEAGSPGGALALEAVEVFAGLVGRIGAAWAAWTGESGGASGGMRMLAGTRGGARTGAEAPVRIAVASVLGREDSGVARVLTQDVTDLDALATQNIRGRVSVLRNADLLRERGTNQAFVYHVPPTGAAYPLWPLFSHSSTIRMAPATLDTLADRLAILFGDLLGVTSESPPEAARPVRVAVTWSFPLVIAGDSASAGGDSPLSVELPVALSPAAAFLPSHDLTEDDGLCRRLSAHIARWLAERAEPRGELRFDIAAYDNLGGADGGNGAKALVEVRDVRIPIGVRAGRQ